MAQSDGAIEWLQTVTLKYADGKALTVTLASDILQRLKIGDSKLMNDIRENWEIANGALPDHDEEKKAPDTDNCAASGSSTAGDADQKKTWSERESQYLVTTRIDMEEQFNGCKNHKALWANIRAQMQQEGWTVTQDQLISKWKSMKRIYKETIDHNAKTGNDPKRCKFYEELNSAYGLRKGTVPTCTISSHVDGPPKLPEAGASTVDAVSGYASEEQESSSSSDAVPRKRRKKVKNTTVSWLESYAEKSEKLQREMHQDKMNRFDRLLTILDKK